MVERDVHVLLRRQYPPQESERFLRDLCMSREVKFRIKTPTIALFIEEGRQVVRPIPSGAEVTVSDENAIQENKLIEVEWAKKLVMMFAQDIRTRAERVSPIP